MRLLLTALCCLVPAAAEAQWLLSTFTGANATRPSTISIDLPAQAIDLDFLDVHYDAKPMKSPQYYGARLTRLLGGRGFGLEAEFLHIKTYARTEENVRTVGTVQGLAVDAVLPMNTLVYRYNHTHGLNFLFANVVWRRALGAVSDRPKAALVIRGGAGPLRPGVDVVTPALNVQGYQLAGWGQQVAGGVEWRLKGWLWLMAEYKLTHAAPEVDLTAGGRGKFDALSHNLAFGITLGK
jgi:hypothetical protein